MDVYLALYMENLCQRCNRLVGMLIGPRALKPLQSIKIRKLRMVVATFNGTPAQQSPPVTLLPILAIKRTSSLIYIL